MSLTCDHGNIEAVITYELLDPRGVPVLPDLLGLYTVGNVTKAHAGTYTCVVTSTLTNATASATATVIVQSKFICYTIIIMRIPINYYCRLTIFQTSYWYSQS